jgi:hypothetical protein
VVEPKIDANDQRRQYCRMLGHEVPFKYCRCMNVDLPCRLILACWKHVFPVEEFIYHHFTKDEVEKFTQPPKPKMHQLYDLMKKAMEAGKDQENTE